MSEYFSPSQFINELQSGQFHDDDLPELDLDAISGEYFGAEVPEDQVLEWTDEFTNSQAPGSSETPGVDGPQQDDLSNEQAQLPDGLDDLFADDEPLPSPEDCIPENETLRGSNYETSLLDGERQPQSETNQQVEGRDDVSNHAQATTADDTLKNGEHGKSEPLGEHENKHDPNESVDRPEQVSNLPQSILDNGSSIEGQQIVNLPSGNQPFQPQPSDFVQGQEGITHLHSINPADALSGDTQPQLDPLALGVANLQGIDQPADGLDDRGILPEFEWENLASPEWNDFGQRAADMELEEILGTEFLPATANETGTAVQDPGPSNVQGTVISSAVNPPMAADHEAVDGDNPDDLDEESEEADTPDQPEFETYEKDDPWIHPDPPQSGWGQTGRRNGQAVWFNEGTSLWQPSASHHDMRATLIARAQAKYPNDRYLHPDPTDGLPHGETAFFKPHQNRGPNRDQCADELFVWREYKSKKDENGKPMRRAKPIFSIRDRPGFMYEGDRVLLDPHNNPVVNHKFIPLTLSAYTDGGKLQEMALKPGCRQLDLWARMPRWEMKTDKNGNSEIISLRDKNTRVNMPMTRFREKKGTLAGGDREGTEVIMEGLTRFYHHHGFDPVASGNSVKAFPRDLTPWEVKEVRLGNTARFGGRAGNRALDDEKREDNLQKTLKAIENGKKKQAAKEGNSSGKRRLEDDAESSQEPSAGAQKRRRRGQEMDPGLTALNEGYAPHREASTGQGFRGQEGGYLQPPRPSRERVNAYGAAQSPYHSRNFHTQASPTQNPPHFNQGYLTTSGSSRPAQNRIPQTPNGGVHMQATRSSYETPQAQAALNNVTGNANYYPEAQYPGSIVGPGRFPTLRSVEPRQSPRVGNYHESRGVDPRSTAQVPPMSQINSGHHPRGPMSSDSYGPPVQQQERHEASAAPRRTGNTLGPGGRGLHHAPQQVLGKRGHRDFGEIDVNRNQSYGAQQEPNNIEPTPDSGFVAPSKRRRTDGNHNTAPPQQRQRRPERTIRPNHYGAEGAPTPLLPPNDFLGSPQPGPLYNVNEEERLMSPEEVSRRLGDVFGSPNPMPTLNQSTRQLMGGTPTRQSEYVQRNPQDYRPPQVLGKHRREEPMGHFGEDMYVPQQNLGQQGPQDRLGAAPAAKRRRMPGTEGYHAPPTQAPRAQVVNNAHRAGRDAYLPSPQLYTNQPVSSFHQAPQVEGVRRIPPQHPYINGTPIYNNASSQITRAQGQTLEPVPPQASHRAYSDIRDVRPSNAQQSQSLHNALSYTRQVYQEWTGLEAPVTNLEDSYNVQYREIRAAFRAWWMSGNNPQRRSPVPELWRMPRWRGTIEDWSAR